jgi:hypothetical protein
MRCACKQKRCNVSQIKWFVGQLVLVIFAIVVLAGCSKRKEKETVKQDEVYTNRANDKKYIASLMTNRQQQVQEGNARLAVSMKMTQCVTRVRAILPADVTTEALTKALAADSEWTSLAEQSKKLEAAANATMQQARNLIRQRMQEELSAQQAVAEGKAKAIDGASAPKTKTAEKK